MLKKEEKRMSLLWGNEKDNKKECDKRHNQLR